MSEEEPHHGALYEVIIEGRTAPELHRYVVTDMETGEPTGYLLTPGSRYGRTSDQTAWWAIAAAYAHVEAAGHQESIEEVLDEFQGYAVNDSPSILGLVSGHLYLLPQALKEACGGEEHIRELQHQEEHSRLLAMEGTEKRIGGDDV